MRKASVLRARLWTRLFYVRLAPPPAASRSLQPSLLTPATSLPRHTIRIGALFAVTRLTQRQDLSLDQELLVRP